MAARNGSDKGWECSVFRIVALFVPVAMLVGLPSAAQAQFTWTNNFATNEWNRSDNWSPTTGFPNSSTATATFGNSGLTHGGTVTINPSVQTKSITFNNTTGSYTIGSAAGQGLAGVTDITVASGVTTTDTINLANVASGSLLFPINSSLNITNNAALGANPTLVIGPNTVIGTPFDTGGVTFAGTGFTRLSGTFADPNFVTSGINKSGTGRLELTGNNGNLGGTNNGNIAVAVSGGTLAINADAALGFAGQALKLDVNSASSGGLEFLNGSVTIARQVWLNSTTRILTNGTDADAISGLISGSGQFVKVGTGTLTLSNASNSYSGGTTINGGTLRLGANNALPTATVITLANASGAALNLNGFSQTIGSLTGGGASGGNVVLGSGTLTVGDASSTTFAGTLSGTGSLTKAGAGTLTLSGSGTSIGILSVNAGAVTVGGGSLSLTASTSPLSVGGSSPATLTVGGGATVAATATAGNAVSYIDGPAGTAAVVTGAGSQLRSASILRVGSFGSGSLTVQNGAAARADLDLEIGVFNGSTGTLLVQAGGTVTSGDAAIAANLGTTGSVTVTGAGSAWSNTGPNLIIGGQSGGIGGGTGSLTVADGGAVTVAGPITLLSSPSSITVNGGTLSAGSLATAAGAVPSIFLSDPAGGAALTAGTNNSSGTYPGPIADAAGGPGTLAKTGAGTLTLSGHLTNSGGYQVTAGTLDFSGAVVQPGSGSLTAATGATIQYDSGAHVFGGFLRGPGTHVLTGGAILTGVTSYNSANVNQTGPATLNNFTNGGSFTNAAGQTLTWSGGINLNESSALFTVNGTANVSDWTSNGVTTINSGGTLSNTVSNLVLGGGSRTTVNSGGAINLNSKTLELNGGLLVNNGTITGTTNVHFNGLAVGTGTFGPVNLFENGRFSPGASAAPVFQPATVATASASFASNTSLAVEIGGKTAGTGFDQVNITGQAVLDGVLAITTTNNFAPATLDSFKVLSFASRSGIFTSYTGQEIPRGLAYAPVYSATDLKLIATLPGDATLDGKVDFNDLVTLAQNYNTTLTTDNWWSSADFTLDGRTDFNDLVLLAQHYNSSITPAAADLPPAFAADWGIALEQASVPEPGSAMSVSLTLTLLLQRRRLRRQSLGTSTAPN